MKNRIKRIAIRMRRKIKNKIKRILNIFSYFVKYWGKYLIPVKPNLIVFMTIPLIILVIPSTYVKDYLKVIAMLK